LHLYEDSDICHCTADHIKGTSHRLNAYSYLPHTYSVLTTEVQKNGKIRIIGHN